VEYETKAFANAPRPAASRRLDTRIEELTARLTQEEREKTEHAKLQRTADKSARDLKFQLVEIDRQRLRMEEEVKGSEGKITSLRNEYNDLVS
jgi:myosin protein heavy chain